MTAADEHTAADRDYATAQTWPHPTPVRDEPDTTTCCASLLLCPTHDRAFHPGADKENP